MRDWHFKEDASICLFRTAGVLLRNNKVLVQSDNGVYALPGGHVKIGETSEETLIREYFEETGAKIRCERLIWVEESFWKWDNKDAHGVVFYYLISSENDTDIPEDYFVSQKDNSKITLEWVSKEKINNIPQDIEHIYSFE